jgi:uncharacterized protein
MNVLHAIEHALNIAFFMFWEILWPLALGFLLSAIVQAAVPKRAITKALGSDTPQSIAMATVLGAASSSCSYAAVAIARSLFLKGASFVSAIAFEFASTNLVFELGLVLLLLLGWQFVVAEFLGGLLMIVILVALFRLTLAPGMVELARRQAKRGLVGRMEGHAEMDMSVTEGPLVRRLLSPRAFTAISHYLFMDLYGLYVDIGLGLLIAGALAAWVPSSFWRAFFHTRDPVVSQFWGPVVGPLVSMISFVCSVGNVPLAAVLWSGGISFGGVISFIFADLLILPILDIYRRYYGLWMSLYLLVTSYVAMVLAGFLIGLVFHVLRLVPVHRAVAIFETPPSWNYTTYLNFVFLAILAVLGVRFLMTGGPQMLRVMAVPTSETAFDPVCGMPVDRATASKRVEYKGSTFYFCSRGCWQTFLKDPEKYTTTPTTPHTHHH